MAAPIDFPDNPTTNQLYKAANGATYQWVGTRWVAADLRAGNSPVFVGPTAPSVLVNGTLWWNSEDGDLYLWFDDGNSTQWVPAFATGTGIQQAMSAEDNLLVNGGFDVWQRGTSFGPFSGAANNKIADRWAVWPGAGSTLNPVYLNAANPGATFPTGELIFGSCGVTRTVSSGDSLLVQRLESVKPTSGRTVTASFWVYAPATGSHTIQYFQYFGGSGSPSATVYTNVSYTVAAANTWERKILTTTIPSISGKTLGTDGTDCLGVAFVVPATFGNGSWFFANVDVRLGPVAPPQFLRRPMQEELALCQRYYQVYPNMTVSGYHATGNTIFTELAYAVTMRGLPTVALSNTSVSNAATMTVDAVISKKIRLKSTVTSTGGGYAYADVALDAEL